MHKYSMSCDMFDFLFDPWYMQFGLNLGFWIGFGFRVGIAFVSDFGGDSKLCKVCSLVGFWFFCLGYAFEIGFRDGFWVWGWI